MKTGSFILALAGIALVSCQTIPQSDPPSEGADVYSALGTEPFWSLKIDSDKMLFERAGLPGVTASPFEARPSFNGWRYLAKAMTVDVTFAPCSDGMSDRTYKDTVTIMFGDTQYKGCGGGILPPASLDHTGWTISAISGVASGKGFKTEVRFADGNMRGTAGCNTFSIAYVVEGDSVSFGAATATEVKCSEPQTAQEGRFLSVLGGGKLTKRFSVSGDLILTNGAGDTVLLKRAISDYSAAARSSVISDCSASLP